MNALRIKKMNVEKVKQNTPTQVVNSRAIIRFFRHTLTYKQTDRLTHKQVVRKTDRQTQTDMQAGR